MFLQQNNMNMEKASNSKEEEQQETASFTVTARLPAHLHATNNLLICIRRDASAARSKDTHSNRARATSATEAQPSPVSQQQQVSSASCWSAFFLPLH